MKKLFALLFALMFLFTACGQAQSSSEPPLITESGTGLPVYALDEKTESLTIRDILNPDKIKQLEEAGITAVLTSAVRGENDTVDLKVSFYTNDGMIEIETTGEVSYIGTKDDFYNFGVYAFTANVWNGNLVLVFPGRIEYYSPNSLEYMEAYTQSFAVGNIIDAVPHGHGILVAYRNGTEQGFAKYSASGEFLWKNIISPSDYMLSMVMTGGGYNRETVVNPRPNLTYIDKEKDIEAYITKETLVYTSGVGMNDMSDHSQYAYPDFVYNISTNTIAEAKLLYHEESEYYGTEFYLFKTFEDGTFPFSAVAFVKENGETVKWLEFDSGILLENFGTGGLEKTDWNSDNSRFTLKCKETDTVLTVDFENGNVFSTTSAQMVENNLKYKHADSADGSYSLWQGEGQGGGDVFYTKIYLVENSTGRVKYIDEIGGMYGGGEGAGFFSNNDVYVISYDDFKIFNTDMNNTNTVYQLAHYYPLGEITLEGKSYYRYLVAARRDPITKDILFVYFDMPYTERYEDKFLDIKKNDWQLVGTYKVALMRNDGTVGYIHDTGVNALTNAFGICPVNIYMDDGNTLHITSWHKSPDNIYFEGTVDLTTGKFTFIEDLSWLEELN